jgi:hypothetical protein
MPDTTTAFFGITKPEPGGSSGSWDEKTNANWDTVDGELALPRLPYATPAVGATTTLDLDDARVFAFTVDETTTIAFSNVPANTWAVRVTLIITNGGAFAVTWPAAVTWLGGAAPVLETSGVDVIELVTNDGGTTWYGMTVDPRAKIGSASALARPLLALYQNHGLSTTSTSEVSLASYSLPAGALGTDGQSVRITVFGRAVTQAGTPNVKFGGTGISLGVSAGTSFRRYITITRTAAATQSYVVDTVNNATPALIVNGTAAETLSGAVTIDFRGSVTAGGTLHYDKVLVEYCAT